MNAITRRSKKKKNVTILYNNIRGVKSKYNSLSNIMEKISPSILALCETKLGKFSKLENVLPNHKLFPRSVKQGKGGLIIGIKKNFFRSALEVTSSKNDNILTVRIAVSDTSAFRVILAYGPQETETVEVRKNFMSEVSIEVRNSLDR